MNVEQNQLLTETGPGAAMGVLFCRSWLPAQFAEELSATDCPRVRVTLLSERLIALRDASGKYGLIDPFQNSRRVRACATLPPRATLHLAAPAMQIATVAASIDNKETA